MGLVRNSCSFALCLILYFAAAPLAAQESEEEMVSGYSGFLASFQVGGGYFELTEHYSGEDGRYYGIGYLASTQFGWALGREFSLFLTGTGFYANGIQGEEIVPRTELNMDIVGKADTNFLLATAGIGFSWYHVPTAFFISPTLYLWQHGVSNSMQRLDRSLIPAIPLADDEYTLLKREITYSSRSGFGLSIGKDAWVCENFGIGFAFSLYYNNLLLEKQTDAVTIEPTGTKVDDPLESDLNRVTATALLISFSIGMVFN